MSAGPSQGPQATINRQLLDAEGEEDRHARLGQLFSNISKPAAQGREQGAPEFGSRFGEDRRTYAVPASDALARAKAFLPLLQSSNAELMAKARADPNGVNIEHTDGEAQVIAMDLGLGLYDVHGEARGDTGPEIPYDQHHRRDADDQEDLDEAYLPVRIVESDAEPVAHLANRNEQEDDDEEPNINRGEAVIATPFVQDDTEEVAYLPPITVGDPDTSLEQPSLHDREDSYPQELAVQADTSMDNPVVDSDSDVDHYSADSDGFEDPDSDSLGYSSFSDMDDDDDYVYDSD